QTSTDVMGTAIQQACEKVSNSFGYGCASLWRCMGMVVEEFAPASEHLRKVEHGYVFLLRHRKYGVVAIGQSAHSGLMGKVDEVIRNSLPVRLAVGCRNQPSLGKEDGRGPYVSRRIRDKAQVERILAGSPRPVTIRIGVLARWALLH